MRKYSLVNVGTWLWHKLCSSIGCSTSDHDMVIVLTSLFQFNMGQVA